MLPVPYDSCVVPITLFDPQMPPAVPQVSVSNSVYHLLPATATMVANEAGSAANNSYARMFCYNLLTRYYWHNDDYREVVKLSADLLDLRIRQGMYKLPEHGLKDCVATILALYTSNLVFTYPELKSVVSPGIIDTALQNIAVFNDMKRELSAMNNGQVVPMHPMNNMGVNAHTPMMNNGMQMQQPMMMVQQPMYPNQQMQPMMNNGMHMQQPQMYPNQGMMQQPMMYPNQGMQQPQYNQNAFTNQTSAVMQSSAPTFDRFSDFNKAPPPPPTPPQQQLVQVETKESTFSELGGSEMERSRNTITFFGDSYEANSVIRTAEFAQAAQDMLQVDNLNADILEFLDKRIFSEPCIETAIYTGKGKQLVNEDPSSEKIFRCFCTVANPILSKTDIASYYQEITLKTSLAEMATCIMSIAKSLNTQKKSPYTASIISMLNTVDNVYTELVNDFLTNKLDVPFTIESFTEDIGGLHDYISKKKGHAGAAAYIQFEDEMINNVTSSIVDTAFISDNLSLPESVTFCTVPINYSFTYVFMNDRELGYKLSNKAVVINKAISPTLYALCASLQKHKKEMRMSTMYDLLITADNVRYRLYSSYTGNGSFLISKA